MPDNLRYKVNTGQAVEQHCGCHDKQTSLLKEIRDQLRQIGWQQVLHPISVPLLEGISSTNAGSATVLEFSKVINGLFIQNNTNANLYVEFDEAAGPNSPLLTPGSNWDKSIHLKRFFIYTAAAQNINVSGGIIIRGWL